MKNTIILVTLFVLVAGGFWLNHSSEEVKKAHREKAYLTSMSFKEQLVEEFDKSGRYITGSSNSSRRGKSSSWSFTGTYKTNENVDFYEAICSKVKEKVQNESGDIASLDYKVTSAAEGHVTVFLGYSN